MKWFRIQESFFIRRTLFVARIDFFLLVEAFLIFLLGVLLGLLRLQQLVVQGAPVVADIPYVLVRHCLLVGQQLF